VGKKRLDTKTILSSYLSGMKESIVSLYEVDGNNMSDGARRDLEEIRAEQIFVSFSPKDIGDWIRINNELGFNKFQDLSNFQIVLHSALIKGDNPQLISRINRLNKKEKAELQFCMNFWEATTLAFYHSIKAADTINLLLKHNEQLRLVNNSLNSPDEKERPNAFLQDQTMQSLSTLLRQRKKDLAPAQVQKPGIIVAGTLTTALLSKDWIKTIQQLSLFGYLDPNYSRDTNLIENWIYFALSFEKEETHRSLSQEKLIWNGTPLALAEFLIKMQEVGSIGFFNKNRTALYNWIDNTIEYSGKRGSLITYFKAKNGFKMNCFNITLPKSGELDFEVLVTARKVKK
jgi:hypothetical protein